jgi:hypothetical protein
MVRLCPREVRTPGPHKVKGCTQYRVQRQDTATHTNPFPDDRANSTVDIERVLTVGYGYYGTTPPFPGDIEFSKQRPGKVAVLAYRGCLFALLDNVYLRPHITRFWSICITTRLRVGPRSTNAQLPPGAAPPESTLPRRQPLHRRSSQLFANETVIFLAIDVRAPVRARACRASG